MLLNGPVKSKARGLVATMKVLPIRWRLLIKILTFLVFECPRGRGR
jgi:hypothetical protein